MKLFFLLPLLIFGNRVFAQYTVNGSASANSCHCYTLTPNGFTLSGSVWNNNKINLAQSFDFNFDIYLGCTDDNGADGIAFMMQPISTSVGSTGGGLGAEGISPSVAVTIDTWQNAESNDPAYDHVAVQLNGNIDHANPASNIAGPVTALASSGNIEDCEWHTLRVKWDASITELSIYIDGNFRLNVAKDFVTDVFGSNPDVYWGFTGSTGGSANLQQFCTALSPKYFFAAGQKRCINEPITFFDSTVSFAAVQKRYWDFGDGSGIDSINVNPVHTYSTAGDYTVTQTVAGADGCSETNTQTLRISGKPITGFAHTDSCVINQVTFIDASSAPFGNISSWFWDFDNGNTSTEVAPATQYSTGGDKNIKLFVQTDGGCVSDTLIKPIHIYQRPVLDFSFTDSVCAGATINFNGIVISAPDPIKNWAWNFGDNVPRNTQNTSFAFSMPGSHTVLFAATSSDGNCLGTIEKPVFIRSKPTAFFKNDFVCQSVPAILNDSSYTNDSTTITAWHWDFGNGQTSNLKNPSVTFNAVDTINIKLSVQSGGCSSDTIIKPLVVSAKPAANFSFSNAACEGQPVQFFDSSKSQNSSIAQWQWISQNNQWSSQQNPFRSFDAGNQTVSLVAVSDKGCQSDTASKNFAVLAKPLFNAGFADACVNTLVNFTATDLSGGIQKWQWAFSNNIVSTAKDTQIIYAASGTYPVVLSAEAGNGCINTDTSFITVYATKAYIENEIIIAAANQPVQLNATGGNSYEWLPVDGLNNPSIANPVATNTEDRQYIVRAYTAQGCGSYDTVLIKILNGPAIYMPTAFSPQSKVASNRIFKATAVGIAGFKYFNVYNRYGQLVFSTNIPSQGWDGTYKGKPQPAGAYVWVAAGVTFRGNEILKKGTVVLLR